MKKAMGMFAALLVALAITGVAFANWSTSLYINGTIKTGKLCVGWENVSCNDIGIDPGKDKDVGKCDVWLSGWKGMHGDNNLYENLNIKIDNAYPHYWVTITACVANGGNIPVNAENIVYSITGDLAPWVTIENYGIISWPDGYPQIDPCHTACAYVTLSIQQDVLIDNEWVVCPQNATANISAAITFVQWNWPPPPPQV